MAAFEMQQPTVMQMQADREETAGRGREGGARGIDGGVREANLLWILLQTATSILTLSG